MWKECGQGVEPDFKFPFSDAPTADKPRRAAQHTWLAQRSWLAYSDKHNGFLCRTCLLFAGRTDKGKLPEGHFVSTFLGGSTSAWQHFSENASVHESRAYHERACELLTSVLNGADSIVVPTPASVQAVDTLRKRLASIIMPLFFLARQGIALRGHRGETIADIQELLKGREIEIEDHEGQRHNPGNFVALLCFLAQYDSMIKDIFLLRKQSDTTPTYHSPTIQNSLLAIYAASIRSRLIASIQSAGFFSILCDEASDVSKREQLSFCVRFVDEDTKFIREVFLEFVTLPESQTGEKIAKAILSTADKLGLDMRNCRGQGYDGASAMSGKDRGAASRITALFPLARYFHCAAHRLSLCVSAAGTSSDIPLLQTALQATDKLWRFFHNSVVRTDLLRTRMSNVLIPGCGKREREGQIKPFCQTRWTLRHELLEDVITYFEGICKAVEDCVKRDVDSSTRADGEGLLNCMRSCKFLYPMIVFGYVMLLLKPLTIGLQRQALDIVQAYKHISDHLSVLEGVRENIDAHSAKWFHKAALMTEYVGGEPPSLPRIVNRSVYAETRPVSSPEEYFRVTVAIPTLDLVISDMRARFPSGSSKILPGLYAIPCLLARPSQSLPWVERKELIMMSARQFSGDFDLTALSAELDLCVARPLD